MERPCPEDTCFPLTSSAFNSFLEELGEVDALELASRFDTLAVTTMTRFTESDVDGQMLWSIEKDDELEVRKVANRVTIGESQVVGYEIWDGGRSTYTRTTGEWMLGRDMDPNYEDPFVEVARLASENPESRWPPFRFDVTQFSGMSWTITGDALDSHNINAMKVALGMVEDLSDRRNNAPKWVIGFKERHEECLEYPWNGEPF